MTLRGLLKKAMEGLFQQPLRPAGAPSASSSSQASSTAAGRNASRRWTTGLCPWRQPRDDFLPIPSVEQPHVRVAEHLAGGTEVVRQHRRA